MNAKSRSNPELENLPEESSGGEYLVYGLVAEQVERFLEEGRAIDVSGLVKQYPHLERQIRDLIPSLAALHQIGPAEEERQTRSTGGFRNGRRTMLGDFALGREIGRGGMGVVYEAIQVSLGRRVALKVLPFAAVLDKRQLQRFKNEAQAAAALHHPHIVPVFAVGCERGVHYYAMQYIEGRDLSAAIAQLRHLCGHAGEPVAADAETRSLDSSTAGGFRQGRDFYRTVAEIGAQAADALEYAHQRGIVHRDIKPSNLMLDSEGKIWVTDFGLAQIETDATLTGTGDLVGTLRYMSPEQISGRPTDVDHRSDIFALGATLYELATLRPLYAAETRAELLRERTLHEPVSLQTADSAMPLDLETIILKAIAKDAQGRYASAGELAADLQRFLNDEPISARRPNLLARIAKWSKRNQKWVAAAAIVVVVGLTFAAGLSLAPHHAPAHQEQVLATDVPGPPGAEIAVRADNGKPAPTTVESPQSPAVDRDVAPPPVTLLKSLRPVVEEIGRFVAGIQQPPIVAEPQNDKPATEGETAATANVQPNPQPVEPAFVVPEPTPPPKLDFSTETDRAIYVGLVKELMDQGFGQTGKSAIQAAERDAAQARRLCNKDPRLDYALGLVYLKNFRPDEARQQFAAADRRADYPYLPAQQAEIWYLLSRKEYETGLDRMAEFVKTIADSPATWPDAATRTAAAHWAGRITGYLEGPGNTRAVTEALQRPGMDFRELLSAAYRPAYDAGRLMTQADHDRYQAMIEDIRKKSQTAQQDRRHDDQDEIAGRREDIAGQIKDIERNSQQWKEWLDDQTSQADEKLDKLEKEYVALEEQAKSLQKSMQTLTYEINVFTQIINNNSNDTGVIARDNARRQLFLRNQQMLRYNGQFNAVGRQAEIVNRNAQTVMDQRRAAVRRYEKETGTFVEKNEKLEKFSQRLKRQAEQLSKHPLPPSAELAAAQRSVTSLRSYVDIDWQTEQQQILKSYETAASKNDAPSKSGTE